MVVIEGTKTQTSDAIIISVSRRPYIMQDHYNIKPQSVINNPLSNLKQCLKNEVMDYKFYISKSKLVTITTQNNLAEASVRIFLVTFVRHLGSCY